MKTLFFYCVVAALAAGSGRVIAQEPVEIDLFRPGSLRTDLEFSAAPGTAVVETSRDLQKWTVQGVAEEQTPGQFRWDDSLTILNDALFYRVQTGQATAQVAWLSNWSGAWVPGSELAVPPEFAWMPFPGTGAISYQFEFCEATDDGDGGLTPLYPALAAAGGLTTPFFAWPHEGTWPAPGGRYLWRVTAVTAERCWQGKWVRSAGVAETINRVRPGSLAAARGARGALGVGVDWNRVIKVMNEITEKKNEIKRALQENPLISELELLKKLKELLGGLDVAKAALDSWLNAPTPALPSAGDLLKVLCFFDSAGEILLKLDKKMPASVKKALQRLVEQVHQYKVQLKQVIENHGDTAGLVQVIVNQLRGLLQQGKFDGSGLWDYLVGWVKDKALEKLKDLLVKELGEKAGGALLSILTDIYSFLDAIENLDDLKALCRAYNKSVLQAIAGGTWPLPVDWEYFGTVKSSDIHCQFTIRPYKRCFKQAGASPYDGDWDKSPVRFSDGSSGKTERFDNTTLTNNGDGTFDFKFPFDLMRSDLECPPGAGPCLLMAEVTVICPGASGNREGTYHFFIQPLPCP